MSNGNKSALYERGTYPTYTQVVEALENKSYYNSNNDSFEDTNLLSKLQEVTNWFNDVAKVSLLRCTDKNKNEEFKFLLLGLKKSVKHAMQSIGKSSMKHGKQFTCSVCNEVITIEPQKDPWDSLQNHEHFEQLYNDYLSGKPIVLRDEVCVVNGYNSSSSNNDRGSVDSSPEIVTNDQSPLFCDISASTGAIRKVPTFTERPKYIENDVEESGLNSFKFNFQLKYDDTIEGLIYPSKLMVDIKKLDGIKENSIQKCGKFKIVCLLCGVNLSSRSKYFVGKHQIVDHISGQKHYKFTAPDSASLKALVKYHDAWHGFDEALQSHQVYFVPSTDVHAKCTLCNYTVVRYAMIETHVHSDEHKKLAIETFLLNQKKKVYSPEILDMQLKGYNVDGASLLAKLKTDHSEEPSARIRATSNGSSSPVTENENAPTPKKVEPKVKPPRRKMEHAVSKSMSNPNGTELSDTLPKRFKEHLKYLEKNGLSYRCTCCQVGVGTSADDIKYHISRSNHLETTKTVLKKCNYFCDICDLHIREEAAWSKHFEGVVTKHENMAASRKSRVTEYECNCGLVLYGDEMSIERHLLASNKSDGNKKLIKLPDEVKKLFPSNDRILEHGHKLSLEANSVLNHKDRTYLCCQRLEKVLSDAFPGCKSYPFGSRISGLGNKDSDLDVFIDVGDMYDGQIQQDCRNQINFVRKSTGIFSKFRDEFRQICPIPSARTPIVKLYHAKTGLDCDISFRHGLSVENTKFISYCIKHQPVLQPFVLLLKKWSAFCRFNEDITTYAFAILAIFYMQINGYLLSVEKIRELDPNPRLVIDGWETFNNNLSIASFIKPCVLSPVDLLKGFFQYYSSFNYEQYIICPLLGVPIEKTLFTEDGSKLPHQMKSYVEKINTMEDPEYFRVKSTCCIQDPFDLSHNLTKACQLRIVSKLKILCDLTHKHLLSVK